MDFSFYLFSGGKWRTSDKSEAINKAKLMVENRSSINKENEEGKNCNRDINLISLDEDPIVTRLKEKMCFISDFLSPLSNPQTKWQ